MLSHINAYLGEHASGLLAGWGYLSASLKPRTFCDAAVIEIRSEGRQWLAGIIMNCGEFARRGNTLVEGSGG